MSERHQHTAAWTSRLMDNRYGDVYHHKHDKRHHAFRLHVRTYPVEFNHAIILQDNEVKNPTGKIRALNLEKTRKRLSRKMLHRH